MTNDAITEARRLLLRQFQNLWGLATAKEYRKGEWEYMERLLSDATGAAEARVTALEQELAEAEEEALLSVANIRALMARATAAEEQAKEWEERYDKENDRAFGAEAERDALQAQLTAARAIRDEIAAEAEECRKSPGVPCQSEYAWHADTYERWVAALDAALPPTPEETA